MLLTAFMCLNCSKADDPEMDRWLADNSLACRILAATLDCPVVSVAGADDDITGRWKLVTALQPFTSEGPITTDHSCHNTVYHFQADGTAVISSDREDVLVGQYQYELKRQPLFESFDRDYTLTIGNGKNAGSIFEGSMVLDNSPLDGPILHLIRVQ